MKRNYLALMLFFVVLVGGYVWVRYSSILRDVSKSIETEVKEEQELAGERLGGGWDPSVFRIVESQPTPQIHTIQSLRQIQQDSMGWIRVLDYEIQSVDGYEIEKMQVRGNFVSEGKEYTAKVDLYDGLFYIDPDLGTPRIANVNEIDIREGDEMVLYVTYLPEDDPLNQDEVRRYCEYLKNKGCVYATDHGFGSESVDIRELVKSDLEDGVLDLDISKVIVSMVKVVRSEE